MTKERMFDDVVMVTKEMVLELKGRTLYGSRYLVGSKIAFVLVQTADDAWAIRSIIDSEYDKLVSEYDYVDRTRELLADPHDHSGSIHRFKFKEVSE